MRISKLAPLAALAATLLPAALASASFSDDLRRVATFLGTARPTPKTAASVEFIIRNAVRTADFVATSTAPGFTYEYNPLLATFERNVSSRGPVFVEPAETVGKGRLDLGMSYLYANFTQIDGESLDDALAQTRTGTFTALNQVDEFSLHTNVIYFSGTYGLTSRWDVNLLLPVLVTGLDLDVVSGTAVPEQLKRFRVNDVAVGPGDLLLRTKYRLPDWAGLAWATFFALRLPTGNQDDFQGLGDVTLAPGLAVTRTIGRHDLHANLGFEFDADDVERSRARYALGATIQALPRLALILDVIGSSGVAEDHFEESFATVLGPIPVEGTVERTDLVDFAFSFKITITDRVLLHLDAIVPLTTDGIRADVVPGGGIEARF